MKIPTVEEWATALESGKYIQGTGCLRRHEGCSLTHCCLGVLLDIAGSKWTRENKNLNDFSENAILPDGTEISSSGSPIVLLQNVLDIKSRMETINISNILINLNDCETPFSEIAKILRNKTYFQSTNPPDQES